jgi:DNA-binding PadR family transcriptional regulator
MMSRLGWTIVIASNARPLDHHSLKAEWRSTENNRRAKYYRITAAGKRQLELHRERWNRVSFAVSSVMEDA